VFKVSSGGFDYLLCFSCGREEAGGGQEGADGGQGKAGGGQEGADGGQEKAGGGQEAR